jgi:chemosensory pili system protein ChpA (sensor histidine kinase/response regulator)
MTQPQTQPHNSELMDAFLEDSWDALAHLDTARVRLSQDHSAAALEELRILSHRMRGTSAIYGYPQFARLAALSERMMEAGQHFISEDYPDLDVFLDQFSACARAAVERIAFGKGEGQVGLEFSSLGAAQIVQGLINKHPKAFLLAPSPKSVVYSEIPLESSLNLQLQTFFQENAETWEYFAPEAKEHLEIIHSLLEQGSNAESEETLVQLFRSTHTLKGSAYMVGFAPMGLLAHRLEDVMSAVRDGGRPYTPEIAEALAIGNETLSQMLEVAEGRPQSLETSLESAIEALEGLLGAEPMGELKELLATAHTPADLAQSQAQANAQAQAASSQMRLTGQLEQFFEDHMEIWGEFSGELRKHLEQLREIVSGEATLDLAAFLQTLHGLKGEASALHYPIFTELTVQLEAVLIEVREGSIDLDESLVQLTERVLENLERIVLCSEGAYPASDLEHNLAAVHSQLASLLGEQPQPIAPPVGIGGQTGMVAAAPQRAANRSIRVNLDKLDNLMNVVGEMVNLRSRFTRQTSQILGVGQLLETSRSRMLRTISEFETKYLNPRLAAITPAKPNPNNPNSPNNPSSTLQTVSEMFNELEFDTYSDLNILARSVIEMADDLGEVSSLLQSQLAGVQGETENLQKLSRRLRDEVSSARMVPLSSLYSRLRRLVKEGAAGKSFQFEVSGETVEIDNYILEEIADPLLHLLKNSIFHGIESQEERLAKGKSASGTIRIRAFPQGNNVMLEVEDDGKGIQLEQVKQKALERKLFDAQTLDEMSEEDAVQLIFSPGLSTAEAVTVDAGRGVGMDAVAAGIRRLNGEISVQTEQDFGTIFTLKLPLTLVVSEALLVECAGQTLAFPALAVRSLRNLERSQIQTLESVSGVSNMTFLEQQVPYRLYSLAALLGLPDASVDALECLVVILDTGSEQFGLIVDAFVGLEEVVQKPLSEALRGLSHLAGATVASSGEVILILDPQGTVRLGNERFVQRGSEEPLRPFEAKVEQRLLLVDDSVSVRRIVSKMLTRAGYQVISAVDGQEALDILRNDQNFTAVLSDLEMPRMNGYELLESMKVREELRNLPIVVMTTRAGEKHRDLAFRLGASEYFSKPIEELKLLGFLERLTKAAKAS